jgi:hypothetical protein
LFFISKPEAGTRIVKSARPLLQTILAGKIDREC